MISSAIFVPAAQVTGAANALALAPSSPITTYEEGETFVFRAEHNSTLRASPST